MATWWWWWCIHCQAILAHLWWSFSIRFPWWVMHTSSHPIFCSWFELLARWGSEKGKVPNLELPLIVDSAHYMVSWSLVSCYFGQYKITSNFQDNPQKSPRNASRARRGSDTGWSLWAEICKAGWRVGGFGDKVLVVSDDWQKGHLSKDRQLS